MRPNNGHRRLVLSIGDAAGALATFAAVVWFRRLVPVPGTVGLLPAWNVPLEPWPWLVLVGAATILAHNLTGTCDEPGPAVRERGGLVVAAALSAVLLMVVYLSLGRAVPRSVLLIWAPLSWLVNEAFRRMVDRFVPVPVRSVVVLGEGEDAERAERSLSSGAIVGYSLLGARRDIRSIVAPDGEGGEGAAAVLLDRADDVVFASARPEDRESLVTLLEKSVHHDFDLWIVPGLADIVATRVVTRSLGDLPVVHVSTRATTWPALALRRVMDLATGTVLLAASLPLLAVTALVVVLESPGRPFIRQRRVGRDGREFQIWKVRTMRKDAEEVTGPVLATPEDERLTRVGPFLRRTRLDELPQLFLVVQGTMTLIGPRPERPEFVARYAREIPAYRLRHLLKPGLTGLAQVMGAYATQTDVKLRYDLLYLFHWSPGLDLFILVRTLNAVLRASGT